MSSSFSTNGLKFVIQGPFDVRIGDSFSITTATFSPQFLDACCSSSWNHFGMQHIRWLFQSTAFSVQSFFLHLGSIANNCMSFIYRLFIGVLPFGNIAKLSLMHPKKWLLRFIEIFIQVVQLWRQLLAKTVDSVSVETRGFCRVSV